MNATPSPTVFSMVISLILHMLIDLAPLIALGGLLSLAMMEPRGKSKGRNRGVVVAIPLMGLALGAVAIAHFRLIDSLVNLPDYYWVHRVLLAVIFGALALPLAFFIDKWKKYAGWLLVAGLIAWVPIGVQGVMLAVKGAATVERMEFMRSATEINNAVTKMDPGALARAIDKLKIPADPSDFDSLLYPTMLESIKSQSPEVARAAARKLEQRGNPEALPALMAARADAPPVARDAIESAENTLAKAQGAQEILFNLVLEGSGATRREALNLLFKFYPAYLRGNLKTILKSGDDELRGMISELLKTGFGAEEDLITPLMQSLSSTDNGERSRALESLQTLIATPGVKDRIDPKPLIKILDSGSADQKRAAAKLLKALSSQDAIPTLTGAARSDDMQLARTALEALVAMNAAKESDLFAKHLESPDAPMRALAFRGLRDTLQRNIGLDDPLVRRIEAAAEKERDPAARRNAAILLAWLDLKDAFNYTDSLLLMAAPSTEDKLAAISAFDLLGEGKAIPKLTALLRDSSAKVRRAAVTVLGNLGDASVVPAIKKLLSDPDGSVREAAQKAIEELAGVPASPTPVPTTPRPPATSEHEAPPPPPPGAPPEPPPW